jgi:hypothetical protein
MTPTTIILSIIILVLVYVLYAYITGTVTQLSNTANLNTAVPPITTVNGARNTIYGYSIWVYVNTWTNNSAKTIFSRDNNMRLYLDNTKPSLKIDMAMNAQDSNGKQMYDTMTVTDNFPLQKWVCIAISVDNQFVDAYLDGKLVKSQRFYRKISTGANTPETSVFPLVPPDATSSPIYLGNSQPGTGFVAFDALTAEFKRWTTAIDPQTAWDTYLAGNGTNGVSRTFSSYGIDIAVLKDNIQQTKFSF